MPSYFFGWFLFLLILVPAVLWAIGLVTPTDSKAETEKS